MQTTERSWNCTASGSLAATSSRWVCRSTMASMKAGSVHGVATPRACHRAITSVAASSTTPNPSSSSWRRIAVLPEPGVPVRMKRFIGCLSPRSSFGNSSGDRGRGAVSNPLFLPENGASVGDKGANLVRILAPRNLLDAARHVDPPGLESPDGLGHVPGLETTCCDEAAGTEAFGVEEGGARLSPIEREPGPSDRLGGEGVNQDRVHVGVARHRSRMLGCAGREMDHPQNAQAVAEALAEFSRRPGPDG